MASTVEAREANWILAKLDADDYGWVLDHAEAVPLEFKQTLYDVDRPITDVYFPRAGVISWVTPTGDNSMTETGTVGREGFNGVPVLLGADRVSGRSLVQVPGRGIRMASGDLRTAADRLPALRALLQRYSQALFAQMAQSVACNRAHPVDERCARWLLMTHDRVDGDTFPLTQEFLAQMLGVQRPTVSTAQSMLQRAGFIRYSRGHVTVADRAGLEQAACPCYSIVRKEFERLIGAPVG